MTNTRYGNIIVSMQKASIGLTSVHKLICNLNSNTPIGFYIGGGETPREWIMTCPDVRLLV